MNRGQKDKSYTKRKSAAKQHLLDMSAKSDLNNGNNNRHFNIEGRKSPEATSLDEELQESDN